MRILVCAHDPPAEPLNGFGLQVRAVFDRLAELHDVRMITYEPRRGSVAADYASLVPRPAAERAARAARWAVGRRPAGADVLAGGLRGPLREALASWRPDVVHVTSGRIAALGGALSGKPGVLAALDAWHLNVAAKAVDAPPLRRTFLRVEERRVRAFVAREYGRFDRVAVVSDEDARALRGVSPALRTVVIPNGVDTARFAPDESVPRDPSAVVFSGVMGYAPNRAAAAFLAREVMPSVWDALPSARLYLVGREPGPAVRALAEDERVTVTGEVASMPSWLNRATVYACPMVSGTGVKNKLLEALSCGVAVVATPLACRGLAAVPDRDLVVGEDAASLAAAIVRLLGDSRAARAVGAAGRRYVLANHTWDATARAYERLYEEIT